MYKSPTEIFYGQMRMQIENDVFKAVQDVGVNVDREELIRALKYDRDQYEKGYADGKADAMADLVRCKECKFYEENAEAITRFCRRELGYMYAKPDGFCSYGERKDND